MFGFFSIQRIPKIKHIIYLKIIYTFTWYLQQLFKVVIIYGFKNVMFYSFNFELLTVFMVVFIILQSKYINLHLIINISKQLLAIQKETKKQKINT